MELLLQPDMECLYRLYRIGREPKRRALAYEEAMVDTTLAV